MRWHRDARLLNVMLVVIGLIGHLVMMWGVLPVLLPYRHHLLVRMLFAFFAGGYLEDLFHEMGTLL
jgi:hypothetical protein